MPTPVRYIASVAPAGLLRWRWQLTIQREGQVSAVHEGVAWGRGRAVKAYRSLMRLHALTDN